MLLRRLVSNLLDNAFRFTPRGGEVRVDAQRATEPRAGVRIRVADTGVGMSPETQDRVFDRFYREDGSRSREKGGAGLGLSICQRIVQCHGGTIGVESALGEGREFTVFLPTASA